MKKLLMLGAFIVICLVLFRFIGIPMFFQKVPVATYGVQQHMFGSGGIIKKDFKVGYQFCFKPLYKWQMMDARTHVIHFTGEQSRKRFLSSNVKERPSMLIRTTDNNTATFDVSVLYRIKEGSAHQLVSKGLVIAYQDRAISTIEGVLRLELAKLTSEEYQNTQLRLKLQDEMLKPMNEKLADYYLECEKVLIRRLKFPAEYEQKLQHKQLQKQLSKLEIANRLKAEEERKTKGLEREIEADVMVKLNKWDKILKQMETENEIKIATINGDMRLYVEKTKALADSIYKIAESKCKLLIQEVEAFRIEGINSAMMAKGGKFYNAMIAVQGLKFGKIILNSNKQNAVNPLEIEKILKMLTPTNQ